MFGFLFGALCLGGLYMVLKHPRHGFGRRCHGHGFRRYGLYRAFQHLDTTPGQEKAIVAAIDELENEAGDLRSKVRASRQAVGTALRGEHLDEAVLESLVAQHTSDFAAFGARAISMLGKIHEVLDPEQRRRLARLIESGPWGLAGFR